MKEILIIILLIFLGACQSPATAVPAPISPPENPLAKSNPTFIQFESPILAEILSQPLEAGTISPDIKELDAFTDMQKFLPPLDQSDPIHLYQDVSVILEYGGYGDPRDIADRILQDMQANGICTLGSGGLAGTCESSFDPLSDRVLFYNSTDRTISVYDLAAQTWLAQLVPFDNECTSYWNNRCYVHYVPFQVYDLSKPASPRLLYEHTFQRSTYPGTYQDYFYDESFQDSRFDIYDVSSDQGPQLLAHFASIADIFEENEFFSVEKFLIDKQIYTVAAPRNGRGQWFITRQSQFETVEDITEILLDPRDYVVHNGIAYFIAENVLLGAGLDEDGQVLIRHYYHPWDQYDGVVLIRSMDVLLGESEYLQLP